MSREGEERPRLAITLGDPRGIGPEIVARALASEQVRAGCDLEIVARQWPPAAARGQGQGPAVFIGPAGRNAGAAPRFSLRTG